jgi:chemotaxis protein methyltransferase CheR
MERALAPRGRLVIGSTESLVGICPQLQPKPHLRSVFYERAAPRLQRF